MTSSTALKERALVPLLIAFADLTRYTFESSRTEPLRLADVIDGFYEIVCERVSQAGGTVVKLMGDAALITFDEEHVDPAVRALLDLKKDVDAYFAEVGWRETRLIVKAHFGPVAAGPFGARGQKRFDLIGSNANIAATLESRGFAISAEAFRKLSPETRRLFKKHTPPITYIRVEDARP